MACLLEKVPWEGFMGMNPGVVIYRRIFDSLKIFPKMMFMHRSST